MLVSGLEGNEIKDIGKKMLQKEENKTIQNVINVFLEGI